MMKFFSKVYIGLILAFLYLPILVLITFSFNESKSRANFTGFTLDWYAELFENELIITSFANTLTVAFLATILATIIGTAAALGISSMKKKPKSLLMNATYLPVINPEIITGISLMLLFVYISNALGLELGLWSVLIAHTTFCLPYVILNILPKLRQLDKNIFEAALDLGCTPTSAFFKVIIPEITPGIIAGALMSFTFSLDDFVITYFTSGSSFQTLPVTIFSMTRKKVSPEINALSTIMFVISLVILILYNLKDIRANKVKK